jgi:hypothetical protein
MNSNAPQLDKLEGLALEYARIPDWRDRMLGRLHPSKRKRLAAWARQGLRFKGRMHYTMTAQRSLLFHRPRGHFLGAYADCSQYFAACAHWSGVSKVTDEDYTGSLWNKGKVDGPIIGGGVIFGTFPGVHIGTFTGYKDGHWFVTGFGAQAGPDVHTLSSLIEYFQARNPGVRYIDVTR